jgi:hypothetical protein
VWQDQATRGGGFGSAFQETNSMQQIVQNRRTTHQQFGQITPPEDSMNEFGDSKKLSAEAVVLEAAERAKSDKSERARNAANQRHAKAKKMRKNSEGSSPMDSDDGEGEVGDKKEKYREKNRLAAAKCRAKKKENIEDIEVKHRKLSAMNASLKKQVQDLRGELTGLRTHALNHQDCNCQISRRGLLWELRHRRPTWATTALEALCRTCALLRTWEAWGACHLIRTSTVLRILPLRR